MNDRVIRIGTRAWIGVTVAAFAVLIGMSAQAALRAINAPIAQVATRPMFAAAVPTIASAAPAPGVTGTTDLPALPIPAAWQATALADGGVQPAQPFSTAAASSLDRGRALECLTAAIYYEAASEPDAGQEAVAQVILNRVRHPAFPATVCGVVYQGSERAGCQFSFACDGAMARVPARTAWARATRAAAMALGGFVYAPVGLATHYHTYAVTPAWNRSLVMTDVVGAHFFHRWKGYWGTPMAFHQRYLGGEPMPGPHARIAPVGDGAPLAPLVLAAATPIAITPATITSAYTDAGAVRAAEAAPTDSLPPASQILDKWKDSGTALK